MTCISSYLFREVLTALQQDVSFSSSSPCASVQSAHILAEQLPVAMSRSALATNEAVPLLACAGSDAVMPETLGSQITIERRLQRSGAAPYTIKDELGRKVSTCKLARCNWQPCNEGSGSPKGASPHRVVVSVSFFRALHLIWYHFA